MGDRFSFLTSENAGSPINSSGCNGFPSKFLNNTQHAAVVGGDYFPIEVPFLTLVKWYWRVKNWKMEVSGHATAGATTVHFPTGNLMPQFVGAFDPPSRELDLLGIAPTNFNAYVGSKDATNQFFLFINTDTTAPGSMWIWQPDGTELLHPSIGISGGIAANDTDDPPVDPASADFSSYSSGDEITATVDGIDVPVFVTLVGDASVDSIVITPIEYWPYAKEDGSPLYNTTTGAML